MHDFRGNEVHVGDTLIGGAEGEAAEVVDVNSTITLELLEKKESRNLFLILTEKELQSTTWRKNTLIPNAKKTSTRT